MKMLWEYAAYRPPCVSELSAAVGLVFVSSIDHSPAASVLKLCAKNQCLLVRQNKGIYMANASIPMFR
jgi:hypothetical protein